MSKNSKHYCGFIRARELLNAKEYDIEIAFAMCEGRLPQGWRKMKEEDHELLCTSDITDSEIDSTLLAIVSK